MIISLPNIPLKESTETQLKFKLSGKESLAEEPVFRFVVTEVKSEDRLVTESTYSALDEGWIFPVVFISENAVMVEIPAKILSMEKRYHGKLEVVVGSRYYTPAQVILEAPTVNSKKTTQLGMVMDRSLISEQEPEASPEENNKSLQGTTGTKPTANPGPKTPKPQAAPQGQQQASPAKTPAAPRQPVPPPNPLINEEKKKELLKKKLLGMMRDALTNDGPGLGSSKVS